MLRILDPRLFVVRRTRPEQQVSGIVSAQAYAGQGYNIDPTDVTKLAAVTGRPAYQLRRSVSVAPTHGELLAEQAHPRRYSERDYVIGGVAVAEKVLEAEIEYGDGYDQFAALTGTGNLTGNATTLANQSLSTFAGKYRKTQSGEVEAARIVAVIPPVVHANNTRVIVQFT